MSKKSAVSAGIIILIIIAFIILLFTREVPEDDIASTPSEEEPGEPEAAEAGTLDETPDEDGLEAKTPPEDSDSGAPPAPEPVDVPVPTPPPVDDGGEPTAPSTTPTPTPPTVPAPPEPYLPSCSNGVWDGDESDLDCGGSCPPCLSTGIYTACWENSDCLSGNCDMSGAQALPATDPSTSKTYNTTAQIRVLAGQSWIFPYQGICA